MTVAALDDPGPSGTLIEAGVWRFQHVTIPRLIVARLEPAWLGPNRIHLTEPQRRGPLQLHGWWPRFARRRDRPTAAAATPWAALRSVPAWPPQRCDPARSPRSGWSRA